MDRRTEIKKMGIKMAVGIGILIIVLTIEFIYFNAKHAGFVFLGFMIYNYVFGRYINGILDRINRDYPKEEV